MFMIFKYKGESIMRKLTAEEIETEEKGALITKIEIESTTGQDPIYYQILVTRCKFKPDANHKNEAASDGYSLGYEILLYNVTENRYEEIRFFTQCTESEVFIHVGNYMGTVYMRNTFIDRYYLKGFDSTIES